MIVLSACELEREHLAPPLPSLTADAIRTARLAMIPSSRIGHNGRPEPDKGTAFLTMCSQNAFSAALSRLLVALIAEADGTALRGDRLHLFASRRLARRAPPKTLPAPSPGDGSARTTQPRAAPAAP